MDTDDLESKFNRIKSKLKFAASKSSSSHARVAPGLDSNIQLPQNAELDPNLMMQLLIQTNTQKMAMLKKRNTQTRRKLNIMKKTSMQRAQLQQHQQQQLMEQSYQYERGRKKRGEKRRRVPLNSYANKLNSNNNEYSSDSNSSDSDEGNSKSKSNSKSELRVISENLRHMMDRMNDLNARYEVGVALGGVGVAPPAPGPGPGPKPGGLISNYVPQSMPMHKENYTPQQQQQLPSPQQNPNPHTPPQKTTKHSPNPPPHPIPNPNQNQNQFSPQQQPHHHQNMYDSQNLGEVQTFEGTEQGERDFRNTSILAMKCAT